jgi:effector-binding domain-containing protein
MKNARLVVLFLLLASTLLAATPGRPRIPVAAKTVGSIPIVYLEFYGPYGRVDRKLREVAEFREENGLGGRLITVYHDNPSDTASAALRSDVGVVLTQAQVDRLVAKYREDLAEKPEEIKEGLHSHEGLRLQDPYKVRWLEPRLVAASNVRAGFREIPHYYKHMRDWIWEHNYYLIGPVVELYRSAPEGKKPVSAEIQLTIERTGVPDRR